MYLLLAIASKYLNVSLSDCEILSDSYGIDGFSHKNIGASEGCWANSMEEYMSGFLSESRRVVLSGVSFMVQISIIF